MSIISKGSAALLVLAVVELTTCIAGKRSRDVSTVTAEPSSELTAIGEVSEYPLIPGLKGKLIHTSGPFGNLRSLDLSTHEIKVLYQPPTEGSLISSTAVS